MRAIEALLIASARHGTRNSSAAMSAGAKPLGPIGRPRGERAVHHADRAGRAEPVDHREVVGHAVAPQVLQERELQLLVAEASAQRRSPAFVEPMERALQPLVVAALGIEPAVLGLYRGAVPAPFEQPAFQDRVQRVDADHGAAERQPRADGALAKALHQGQLGLARQAGCGDPLDQRQEMASAHGAVRDRCARAGKRRHRSLRVLIAWRIPSSS